CRPATRTCFLSADGRTRYISRASTGKHAWSPVSSISNDGAVTLRAFLRKFARLVVADQVDIHAAGVVMRPKPAKAKLPRSGRLPNSEPYGRRFGSSDKSTPRKSASVR